VWEMMVAFIFGKKLQFVVPSGSMFGFNGLVTADGPWATERFPHTALKRRLMGFAVKQASGGPKEAMDEIQDIICAKACESATRIMGEITQLDDEDRRIYTDAWKKADGLECFEDLFQIAGNLIDSTNVADFARKGRRKAIGASERDEEIAKAAVGGLSEARRKRLDRKLNEFLPPKPTGEATPNELDKVSDEMTKVGFLAPDSTGHCLQKNSECPAGPGGGERSMPAKVKPARDMFKDIEVEDSEDSLAPYLPGGAKSSDKKSGPAAGV